MTAKKLKYPADWIERKKSGPPISVITVYDASMAKLAKMTDVDALLVGDSLSMVVQGNKSTMKVSLDEMVYHSKIVRKGAPGSFIIGDLSFGSYQISEEDAMRNAIRMMKDAEMDAVKMEGTDAQTLRIIEKLVRSGVPVMGHIGLLPQSYLNLGGYRIQGKDEKSAAALIQAAKDLENAGAFSMILEYIVKSVSGKITETVGIPTIGIGSGNLTSGQVLVWHDALGMESDFKAKHAKRYAELDRTIINALNEFSAEVKDSRFPADEHSFE